MQTDLNLHWAHLSEGTFFDVADNFIIPLLQTMFDAGVLCFYVVRPNVRPSVSFLSFRGYLISTAVQFSSAFRFLTLPGN